MRSLLVGFFALLIAYHVKKCYGQNDDQLFLCGFRLNSKCDFNSEDVQSFQCQLFTIDQCMSFRSTQFEQFGVTEVYARLSRNGNNFNVDAYTDSACTLDPFGLSVFARNLKLDSCGKLTVSLVGQQLDLYLARSCPICIVEDTSVRLPPGVIAIDYPKISGYPICANEENVCELIGYDTVLTMKTSVGSDAAEFVPEAVPLYKNDARFIWCDGGLQIPNISNQPKIVSQIWCNETNNLAYAHFDERLLRVNFGECNDMIDPTAGKCFYVYTFQTPFQVVPETHWSVQSPINLDAIHFRHDTMRSTTSLLVFSWDKNSVTNDLTLVFTVFTYQPRPRAAIRAASTMERSIATGLVHVWDDAVSIFKSYAPTFGYSIRQLLQIDSNQIFSNSSNVYFEFTEDNRAGDIESIKIYSQPLGGIATDFNTPSTDVDVEIMGSNFIIDLPNWTKYLNGRSTIHIESFSASSYPTRNPFSIGNERGIPRRGFIVNICRYSSMPQCEAGTYAHSCAQVPLRRCFPTSSFPGLSTTFLSVRVDSLNGLYLLTLFRDRFCLKFSGSSYVSVGANTCSNNRATSTVWRFNEPLCNATSCRTDKSVSFLQPESFLLSAFSSNLEGRVQPATSPHEPLVTTGVYVTTSNSTELESFLFDLPNRDVTSLDLYARFSCNTSVTNSITLMVSRDVINEYTTRTISLPCTDQLQWVNVGTYAIQPVYNNSGLPFDASTLTASVRTKGAFINNFALVDAREKVTNHLLSGIEGQFLQQPPTGTGVSASTPCNSFTKNTCPFFCTYNLGTSTCDNADQVQSSCREPILCFGSDNDDCHTLSRLSDTQEALPADRTSLAYQSRWQSTDFVLLHAVYNSSFLAQPSGGNETANDEGLTVVTALLKRHSSTSSIQSFSNMLSLLNAEDLVAISAKQRAFDSSISGRSMFSQSVDMVALEGVGDNAGSTVRVSCETCNNYNAFILFASDSSAILSFNSFFQQYELDNVMVYKALSPSDIVSVEWRWTTRGVVLISGLEANTEYGLVFNMSTLNCGALEPVLFSTVESLSPPVINDVQATNTREVLLEWSFAPSGYVLEDIIFDVFVDDDYFTSFPAGATHGGILREGDDVSCTVDAYLHTQRVLPQTSTSNAFHALLQDVRYTETAHAVEVSVRHQFLGILTARSEVGMSPISPYPVSTSISFHDTYVDGVENGGFVWSLSWDPVLLTNGSTSANYRVLITSLHADGAVHVNVDDIVHEPFWASDFVNKNFVEVFTKPEVFVESLGHACTLPTLSACEAYTVTEPLRRTIVSGNITGVVDKIVFLLDQNIPPMIFSAEFAGLSALVIGTVGAEVTEVALWEVEDDFGNKVASSDLNRFKNPTYDNALQAYVVAFEFTPFVVYGFDVKGSFFSKGRSEPHFLRSPNSQASPPRYLSVYNLTSSSFTVTFSDPIRLGGALNGYHLGVVATSVSQPNVSSIYLRDLQPIPGDTLDMTSEVSYHVDVRGLLPATTYRVVVFSVTSNTMGQLDDVYIMTLFGNVDDGTAMSDSSSSSSASTSSSKTVSSGGIIAAIICGVVLGTIVALFIWRRQIKNRELIDGESGTYDTVIEEVQRVFEDRHPHVSDVLSITHLPSCILKRHHINVLQQVQLGQYGTVHKCTVGKHDVPAFTLRVFKSTSTFHSSVLISEAFILSQLEHEHIVYSLGFALKKKPFLITLEHYPNVSLQELLIERKLVQFGPQMLTPTRLLELAKNVCSAMALLHIHGIVNGALGAHQLLTTPDGDVKIYQFARPISSSSLSPFIQSAWKPIEMLDGSLVLTPALDIWQFGMLLWQIMSYGVQPFEGLSDPQVLDFHRTQRLKIPQGCKGDVYQIMEACWSNMDDRPSFSQLLPQLEAAINKSLNGKSGKFRHTLNKKYNFGLSKA
eukprot:m.102741 g.102741  ORF g.102741 m.102741 type:complete len:1899 (+) comp9085_c0_seq1:652-6348(+)